MAPGILGSGANGNSASLPVRGQEALSELKVKKICCLGAGYVVSPTAPEYPFIPAK